MCGGELFEVAGSRWLAENEQTWGNIFEYNTLQLQDHYQATLLSLADSAVLYSEQRLFGDFPLPTSSSR